MGLASGSAELAKVARLVWPILATSPAQARHASIAAISAIALIGIAVGICIPTSLHLAQ